MTDVELVIALRSTESRSKRALLDEAADRLEQLATEVHKGKEGKMDAVEFIKARNRMCRNHNGCFGCPLEGKECDNLCDVDADTIVPIVEQWAKEHPIKTRQSVFLEMFPNAALENGTDVLRINPCYIEPVECGDNLGCCVDCRREFWMQEVE